MSFFPTALQEFVYYDKYARWNEELGRRETWPETVRRVVDFLIELSGNKLQDADYKLIHDYILNKEVSPSMRLFATAGEEARRNHVALYNCCFLPIESIDAITELLWVSMSGVGAGYSVEQQYISRLPTVKEQDRSVPHIHVVDDSAEGWVYALKNGLKTWFNGKDVTFDYSNVRPPGTLLKTKGGTASGPDVLQDLLDFTRKIVLRNQGRKLKPIDVFDICTMIGSCAVSGGSRRSAQLTMFDLDDIDMLQAKHGEYWTHSPHRANANISAVVKEHLTHDQVSDFMTNMFNGYTGEPGITSRLAMNKTKPERRRYLEHGGFNACSEVNLHGATRGGKFGGQFCNLSTAQVYPKDTISSLVIKARVAAVIGTIQSMATDFRLLRPAWKKICEEERLLGVSLIGIMDNSVVQDDQVLQKLRDTVIETNKRFAEVLGINQSAATTAIKPSGNSSVLYGVARGINARYAPYYIRRVRVNTHTPMYHVLKDSGIPLSPENDQYEPNVNTHVATFYEKSPNGSPVTSNLSAIDQLENWKLAKLNWCEHNPSVTIEYEEHEKQDVIEWVYQNQEIINGLAFLPRSEHIYRQAPYEPITKEQYNYAIKGYPNIDFSLLKKYEKYDTTTRTIECSANACDLV